MTGRVRGAFFPGLAVLTAVALWTRLETLGRRPLWFDERFTFFMCAHAKSLRGIWTVATKDAWEHPPLHYAVTYLAMKVSHAAAVVRLPSALCGVLAVPLLALLGRRLFDARTGLVAGVLLGLSIYHVHVSMDARPYALLLLLLLGEYLAFFTYRETGERWLLAPFAVCAAASAYTHHLALAAQLAVAVLALWDVATARGARRRSAAWLIAAGTAAVLAYLPQAVNLAHYLGTGRLEKKHVLRLSWHLVWHVAARWGVGDNPGNVLVLLAFATGVGTVLVRRRKAAGLLLCLVAPFLPFLLVPFGKFFDIRFVIAGMPPFLLLTAAGLVAMGEGVAAATSAGRVAAMATTAALTLCLAADSLAGYRTFRRTTLCCSEFWEMPGLMERDGGFCRDRIMLNTFYPDHAFLLRPVRLSGRAGSPIVGPR
jgi:mannosyltransferase